MGVKNSNLQAIRCPPNRLVFLDPIFSQHTAPLTLFFRKRDPLQDSFNITDSAGLIYFKIKQDPHSLQMKRELYDNLNRQILLIKNDTFLGLQLFYKVFRSESDQHFAEVKSEMRLLKTAFVLNFDSNGIQSTLHVDASKTSSRNIFFGSDLETRIPIATIQYSYDQEYCSVTISPGIDIVAVVLLTMILKEYRERMENVSSLD